MLVDVCQKMWQTLNLCDLAYLRQDSSSPTFHSSAFDQASAFIHNINVGRATLSMLQSVRQPCAQYYRSRHHGIFSSMHKTASLRSHGLAASAHHSDEPKPEERAVIRCHSKWNRTSPPLIMATHAITPSNVHKEVGKGFSILMRSSNAETLEYEFMPMPCKHRKKMKKNLTLRTRERVHH